jgi:hypothetical protein
MNKNSCNMPHISSNVNLEELWIKGVMQLIPDLMYCSYATQRDEGMSHEDCLKIGLGREEYNEIYNNEKK